MNWNTTNFRFHTAWLKSRAIAFGIWENSCEERGSLAMDQRPTDIVRHFEGLSDPRTGNAKTHIFLEILIIAICAVICGADGLEWHWIIRPKTRKNGWKRFWNYKGHSISWHLWASVRKNQTRGIPKTLHWWVAGDWKVNGRSSKLLLTARNYDVRTIRMLGKRRSIWWSAWATQTNLSWVKPKSQTNPMRITAIPELLQLLDTQAASWPLMRFGTQTEIAKNDYRRWWRLSSCRKRESRSLVWRYSKPFWCRCCPRNWTRSVQICQSYQQRTRDGLKPENVG